MLTYPEFLAAVQPEHLHLLSTFVLAQRTAHLATDTAAADATRARVFDLYTSGMCWRVIEGRERDGSGQEWITFEGHVTPEGQAHVAQAAKERVILSREPLPQA